MSLNSLLEADFTEGYCYKQCRICRSPAISKLCNVNFYFGYEWPIYDCYACGCRFTYYDSTVYDLLYSETASCYERYLVASAVAKTLFDRGDLAGLKAELSKAAKCRFVIENVDRCAANSRLLEIGCSRGHLTSYFVLSRRPVVAVDVSSAAVDAAKAAFGDHFVLIGDRRVEDGAPYDVIYHVGTIGCVGDPVGLTRDLLALLKPGGMLLFNAPNRQGLHLRDEFWFASAPPPDVVTLFPAEFWQTQFAPVAEVEVEIEMEGGERNFMIWLSRLAGRRWEMPIPLPLSQSMQYSVPAPSWRTKFWKDVERVVRKVGREVGIFDLAPKYPTEFGVLVKMTKR